MTAASTPAADDLEAEARAWMADDPDAADRASLAQLLADGGAPARADLADRFSTRLTFGTAGLRGALGAGPNRMNRAVVRGTTAALARWLTQWSPTAQEAGVVVGCDARHGSRAFAEETARVLLGAGFRLHLLRPELPTPLLAFSVPYLGAAAGVMITASHNPPADNGYKLYLADGAQIVPPADEEIEASTAVTGPLADIPLGDLGSPLLVPHDADLTEAYLEAVTARSPAPEGAGRLRIVYTPLHGVALGVFTEALRRTGFPEAHVVAPQAEPDGDFPTLPFPNPEEPGALDLALALGRQVSADVVVANDPDGDRLAVAVPDPDAEGGWRRLSGDQVGCLLGAYLLERTGAEDRPGDRLVATTIVSSSMLSRIAADAGVHYAETLTGFKWIVRAHERFPHSRLVLGYEEALGYSVGEVVHDKDGIGAALALLGLLTDARRVGSDLLGRWDDLERRHGVHLTRRLSVLTHSPAAVMERLRSSPPERLGDRPVTEGRDLARGQGCLPPADVLVYRAEGGRLVVRPSGTEPKLKAYVEVVEAVHDGDLAGARGRAGAVMESILAEATELLA